MKQWIVSERDLMYSKLPLSWIKIGWESIIEKLIYSKKQFLIYRDIENLWLVCECEDKPPDSLLAGIKWVPK